MIRVLVVDDSAVVRQVLTQELKKDPLIEVIGAAPDPYVAREMIAAHRPDVLTLDLEMPRMDGLSFLRQLMKHHPLPTLIVSSLTPKGSALALEAMAAGAVEVVQKPGAAYRVGDLGMYLREKVKSAAGIDLKALQASLQVSSPPPAPLLSVRTQTVVAIGASTGGTIALEKILRALPVDAPGIVISQHMPPGFTQAFAERLSTLCKVKVREAKHGDPILTGGVLIAPGNQHLLVKTSGARSFVELSDEAPVNRHRPSVDVMFRSVARALGPAAVGVILTGMGADGADGLLEMKRAGATMIAQDEASCVVFGMPREAIERGAADEIVPLDGVAARVLEVVRERARVWKGRPEDGTSNDLL